jgi:hypothetical protein
VWGDNFFMQIVPLELILAIYRYAGFLGFLISAAQ